MRTPGLSSTQMLHDQLSTRQGCRFTVVILKGIYQEPCHNFLYPEARFHVCAGRRGNLPSDLMETRIKCLPEKRMPIVIYPRNFRLFSRFTQHKEYGAAGKHSRFIYPCECQKQHRLIYHKQRILVYSPRRGNGTHKGLAATSNQVRKTYDDCLKDEISKNRSVSQSL